MLEKPSLTNLVDLDKMYPVHSTLFKLGMESIRCLNGEFLFTENGVEIKADHYPKGTMLRECMEDLVVYCNKYSWPLDHKVTASKPE